MVSTFLKLYFLIAQGVILLSNLADSYYFRFSGKRTGTEFLQLQQDFTSMFRTYVADYGFLLLIVAAALWALSFLYNRISRTILKQANKSTWKAESIALIILVLFFGVLARGGFYLKPVRVFDAAKFVEPELIPYTVNTPFQFISTIGSAGVQPVSYMDEKEAEILVKVNRDVTPAVYGKPRNVVLIILESFGKEYTGWYNQGKGYTPFLDSLCRQSTVYMHAYANARKSIEGIPAIIAGVPNLMNEPYINSNYQGNTLHSAGWYLHEAGYTTSFFHGAHNGTMGLENFAGISSLELYYGLDQYPGKEKSPDFDGNWGIFDGPYLQYWQQQLSAQPQPFLSAVFTLSSHHPYTVPAPLKDKFPKGTIPIHASIGYTDMALRDFFRQAAQQPWYNNTLFIITADHASENETPHYQTLSGKYEIPLLVFDPQHAVHSEIGYTIQQIDIPALAVKASGKAEHIFSLSVPSPLDSGAVAIQMENGIYQAISWPWVLHFDGNKVIGFYRQDQDSLLKQNLAEQQLPEQEKLLKSLKAGIQVYRKRLIDNRFY